MGNFIFNSGRQAILSELVIYNSTCGYLKATEYARLV